MGGLLLQWQYRFSNLSSFLFFMQDLYGTFITTTIKAQIKNTRLIFQANHIRTGIISNVMNILEEKLTIEKFKS